MTLSDARKIKKAVRGYNASPWCDFPLTVKRQLRICKEKGVDHILETIRKADIRNYHREEGRCGNL